MKNLLKFSFVILVGLVLNSCGTYQFNRTKEFTKFNASINELNGEYYGFSELNKKNNSYRNIINLFNLGYEADFVNLEIDQNKVKLSYWQDTADGAKFTEEVFEGKLKNKFLEIYFEKKQLIIPFLLSSIQIDRIRIGKDQDGNLVIMNFNDHTGNILIFGGGFSTERAYIFKRAEYSQLKPLKIDEKWGYVDNKNNILIEPQFDFGKAFQHHSALVKLNDKWGLIDSSGQLLTEIKFDRIEYLDKYKKDPFYKVFINNKVGLIDASGKEIIPVIYDEFKDEHNEYFEIILNGKIGIGSREKVNVPAVYEKLDWYNLYDGRPGYEYQKGYKNAVREGVEYLVDLDGFEYDEIIEVKLLQPSIIKPILNSKRKIEFEQQKTDNN